ncbi:MAG: DNA replication/repair protein RecF [Acidiferrobacterales bacterium]
MSLLKLEVHDLRIVERASLRPTAGLNVIVGPNASGKTTLLEAIHILSRGKSFRQATAGRVVRHGADALMVRGQWAEAGGGETALGVQRAHGERRVQVDGRRCERLEEFVRLVPLQTLLPDARHLFTHSARYRRAVIDWGLFHVEPRFYTLWLRYRRALRQRNAALQRDASDDALVAWDAELAEAGEALHVLRAAYWRRCGERAAACAKRLEPRAPTRIELRQGWPSGQSLSAALRAGRVRDRATGYTQAGPHRADLAVYFDDQPIRERASHGQQKLLVAAVRLAQTELLIQATGRSCVMLLDDIAGELDAARRRATFSVLAELGAQVFATTTEQSAIDITAWRQWKVFHVEHGRLGADQGD